jgi:eukaryotic-like serine/threonine-protein kinase
MADSTDLFLSLQEALAGRYSIDRELGRGGMGVVFLAHEVHLDRLVAIKVLPPERAADPALRERFLREVRLAARLSHPNIIPIHAVEETQAFVFYVMAFVDGETLTERVRSRGPFPGSEGARVLREVAWALAYAHGQGIVHRDVKPDNILLERTTGRVLVADFGIAAALGNASIDGVTGTPEVMSPEQVLGKPLDARTDIYALGATAYFAFSGRYPFEGSSTTELLAKHVATPAPTLASLGLPVPRKLGTLVDHCLRKEAADRPPTANNVAEKLTLVLEQRREIPVALRSFIKRAARINGTGALFGAIAMLPVSVAASIWSGSSVAGFATFVGVGLTMPLIYMTTAARRLVRQGFAHADLEPAFRAEIEQSEEDIGIEGRVVRPIFEKALQSIAFVSTGVAAASLGATLFAPTPFGPPAYFRWLGPTLVVSSALALGFGFLWSSYAQQRRDLDTRFWSRLWKGPMGRAAFTLGARFSGSHAKVTAMTHRATELSIGLAAEQLFDSLPREVRKELAAVPGLVNRLQRDVQSLRRQQEELQELIGGEPSEENLRVRASVHGKLTDAVGALETIRLDLLRLHAGSTTVQSVTTHMGIAEDVSREINRMIAASADVDRMLAFPREAAPTPV